MSQSITKRIWTKSIYQRKSLLLCSAFPKPKPPQTHKIRQRSTHRNVRCVQVSLCKVSITWYFCLSPSYEADAGGRVVAKGTEHPHLYVCVRIYINFQPFRSRCSVLREVGTHSAARATCAGHIFGCWLCSSPQLFLCKLGLHQLV